MLPGAVPIVIQGKKQGNAVKYITRSKAVNYLQISVPAFRLLFFLPVNVVCYLQKLRILLVRRAIPIVIHGKKQGKAVNYLQISVPSFRLLFYLPVNTVCYLQKLRILLR